MPHAPDHQASDDHRHHPLLRVTITACPDDTEALLCDVDLGAPLASVTAEEVAAVLAVLADGLAHRLDLAWQEMAAHLN